MPLTSRWDHRIAGLADVLVARGFRSPEMRVEDETISVAPEFDAAHHLRYLAAAAATGDRSLFIGYVQWGRATLLARGIPDRLIAANLEITRAVLGERLPAEDWARTLPHLEAAAQEGPASLTVPTFIGDDEPHAEMARTYLELMLAGDRLRAARLVLDRVEAGMHVGEVYLHVFAPAQREVGRLWQVNRATIAQEHLFTAGTQVIMSQLWPYIAGSARRGRCLVATAVGDELHEVGIRMVADFLEMDGWDTFFLGANTPAHAVISELRARNANLLAVSATMSAHIPRVIDLIAAIRRIGDLSGVAVLVGGPPFNASPELWRTVGADGFAENARDAVDTANELVGEVADR